MSNATLGQFCLVPDEALLPLPDESCTIKIPDNQIIHIDGISVSKKDLRMLYHGRYKNLKGLADHFKISPVRMKRILAINQIPLISGAYVRQIVAKKRSESFKGHDRMVKYGSSPYLQCVRYDPEKGKVTQVAYHREVVRRAGYPLDPNDRIHHIDLNKSNNDISNLFICKGENAHQLLHKDLDTSCAMLIQMGVIKFVEGRYVVDLSKLRDEDVLKLKYPPHK